jgi:hypothetical protein
MADDGGVGQEHQRLADQGEQRRRGDPKDLPICR